MLQKVSVDGFIFRSKTQLVTNSFAGEICTNICIRKKFYFDSKSRSEF